MKNLGLNELRETYLKFFEEKGHLRVASASLVPHNDKSLLLIPAGMAPMKPYFTGQETPPSVRLASCQRCVRTNDIENVGVTPRHCTLFEMLGNFSFGDYFKEEAIEWAWEFLTEVLEISESLLYPSVYLEDDEAFGIWRDKIGIAPERIIKLGKEDNFWEHGTGPCGPCSEIYFDRGVENGCDDPNCRPGCDCDRFIEIWNLVFTQFNKNEDGSYTPLEKKNIDTGMGLERIALAMQGADTLIDVDTFKAARDAVCREAGIVYGKSAAADKSVRIITDHARAVTFMLSDGIMPSNEGRGYVLRRLLRRAALHGKLLGIKAGFFNNISQVSLAQSQEAYPELKEKAGFIKKIIETEEQRFQETLDQGLEVLKKRLDRRDELNYGELAFLMYDTFGFPSDLTLEIMKGEGLNVGQDAFNAAFGAEMEKQRTRAREARGESNYMGAEETALTRLPAAITTRFSGYEAAQDKGRILALITGDEAVEEGLAGAEVIIVPDVTPLYAEGGGQKGDSGVVITPTGKAEIYDCKRSGSKSALFGKVISGCIKKDQEADIMLDEAKRIETARNHSATHLLHRALKEILGSHAEQAGSLVSRDRLRFDFSHFQPLTEDELRSVEDAVNAVVLLAVPIKFLETTPDKAREMGAVALFGEKYEDTVRVVEIEDYSAELCGGCHVNNTAEIGMFKILSESGIAAGVRRIEAVTGSNTLEYYRGLEDRLKSLAAMFKTSTESLTDKAADFLNQRDQLQKELNKLKKDAASGLAEELLLSREQVGQTALVAAEVSALDPDERRELADRIRAKLNPGPGLILLIFKEDGDSAAFLACATERAVKSGIHCGNIVRDTLKNFGGRGGGKPDMAQGGVPAGVLSADILAKAKELIS